MNQNSITTIANSMGDKITYTLRNDMVFHCVMQHSKASLKLLICSIKNLKPNEVKDVILANPIDYNTYNGKEIILDVRVILNNYEIITVELQMYTHQEWEKRVTLYLCRSFDTLDGGDAYNLLKPTTLVIIERNPKKNKEFFSTYKLSNLKSHKHYTSLLTLNVL